MSGSAHLDRQMSESSDYDVSDLLSIVSNESSASRAGQKDTREIMQSRPNHGEEQRAQISLRDRRRSRVQGMPLSINGLPNLSQMNASGVMQLPPSSVAASSVAGTRKAALWKRALTKAIATGDPWSSEGFDDLSAEIATRYRFDTRNRKWTVDEVHVKMQEKPFGRGAMRQCFRLKKKSNFATRSHDFSTASNCVAKNYLDPAVTRQTYFDDVYLQMDAKYWAERFNLNNPDPPKKIDLIQVAILEFPHRPGSPLYHLEHFIEGEYIKYNSNSGFIDLHARMTPQAFSHFTFERSGRRLMIVDVQGVGDLYTDPQIHTAYTSDMYSADEAPPYGDGNLGIRGMALFLYSHRCNQICSLLGLTPFQHSPYELDNASHRWRSSSCSLPCAAHTGASGADSPLGATVVRQNSRSKSGGSWSSDDVIVDPTSPASHQLQNVIFPISEDAEQNSNVAGRLRTQSSCGSVGSSHDEHADGEQKRSRKRIESQMLPEDAKTQLADIVDPLDADTERHPMKLSPDEILALVHLDFAKCYDSGRFAAIEQMLLAAAGATPVDSVIQKQQEKQDEATREVQLSRDECEAALFHLEEAAKLGNKDAIQLLARIYLNMERDLLKCLNETSFSNEIYNAQKGIEYMRKAAAFDADSALFLGQLFESGKQTRSALASCVVEPDVKSAITYYAKAVEMFDDDASNEYIMPPYEVHAKLAELYSKEEVRDYATAYDCYSAAAEAATASMKGKLAARYYQLAEEVSALIEE